MSSTIIPASTAYDPAPLTRGDLLTKILNPFGRTKDDPIDRAVGEGGIRSAVNDLNRRTWRWNEKTTTYALEVDDFEFQVPQDFKSSRVLRRIREDGRPRFQPLVFVGEKNFRKFERRTIQTVRPRVYTVFFGSRLLRLDAPMKETDVSQTPTMRLDYFSRLSVPTTDAGVIGAPPEVEEYILWRSRAEVASNFGDEGANPASDMQMANIILIDLVRDNRTVYTDGWKS